MLGFAEKQGGQCVWWSAAGVGKTDVGALAEEGGRNYWAWDVLQAKGKNRTGFPRS